MNEPSARSPLFWRITLSAVIIPALIGLFVADHYLGTRAPLLLVFVLLLAGRAAWELCDLLRARNIQPHTVSAVAGSMFLVLTAWYLPLRTGESAFACGLVLAPILLGFVFVFLLLLLGEAARYREPGRSMESLGANLLTVTFIGLLLAVTAQLRWVAGADAGYLVLASMIIATKCGDIGAYSIGRLFGKRKMAPVLSPNKTWAGAFGAVLFSGAAGFLWLQFAPPLFNPEWSPPLWWLSVIYGVSLGVAGLLGDLCESLIKRDLGRKDSAALMPGFGGVLDLIDSPLFAGPVAYVLWITLALAAWQ